MGLIYAYLAAWILGGVLLGSSMLLAQTSEHGADEGARPTRSAAWPGLQLLALALIGFGLAGLAGEGLGLAPSSWSAGAACLSSLLLACAGYLSLHKRG